MTLKPLSAAFAVSSFLWLLPAVASAQCGAPDVQSPAVSQWSNRILTAIFEDAACSRERLQESLSSSACNIFVGRVLERVYGVRDFVVTPSSPDRKFYTANEIATYIQTGIWSGWHRIGQGNDQTSLNRASHEAGLNRLVVAVLHNPAGHGHVALVGPGPLTLSGQWGLRTPVSAQFRLNRPDSAYIGKPLACAFDRTDKDKVELWVRIP